MVIDNRTNLLSVPQAAAALNLKPATIRRWILTRRIGIVKLGRSVRIQEREIQRLIDEGYVPALAA